MVSLPHEICAGKPGQEQGENSAEGCLMLKMVDIQIHAIVLETLEAMPAFKPQAGPAKVLSVLCFYVYCCGIVLLQVISASFVAPGDSSKALAKPLNVFQSQCLFAIVNCIVFLGFALNFNCSHTALCA